MTDARECILAAADKLTALEKAKVELETVKQKVADLKQEYDDQIAACEEAGLTKAKARKAVQGIVDVLVDADLVDLPAEKPKTPRKPRASKATKQQESSEERDEASEDSSEAETSCDAADQDSAEVSVVDDVQEGGESSVETSANEEAAGGVSDIEDAAADDLAEIKDVTSEEPVESPTVNADIGEDVSSSEEFGEPETTESLVSSEVVSEDEIDVFDDAADEEVAAPQQEPAKRSDFSLPAFMRK